MTIPVQKLSDEQLVIQFQTTKDNKFFGEIYNRYYRKAYHTCLGIVKNQEVAADLVQDVMIKVMESLPTLQNAFLLGLWIHRIAKNYSLDYHKERKCYQGVSTYQCFDPSNEEAEKEAQATKENRLLGMEKAMKKLIEDDQTLLTLKYYENYSIEDLQIKYALSGSAVKMRLARARKRVVNLYQQEERVSLFA